MDGACLVCFVAGSHLSSTRIPGSFESVRWNVCCTDCTSAYTLIQKSLGNGVNTHGNSKGKIPSTGGSGEGRTLDTLSRRTTSPTHYGLSYPGPFICHNCVLVRHVILHTFYNTCYAWHVIHGPWVNVIYCSFIQSGRPPACHGQCEVDLLSN